MKVALLLGLLLVAGPILGADYQFPDSSYFTTTAMTATSSSGATGGVVTIQTWFVGTDFYLWADTTKDGDLFITFGQDNLAPAAAGGNYDCLRLSVASGAALVEDGTCDFVASKATNFVWKKATTDPNDDWSLVSTTDPKSFKAKATGSGFTVAVKRKAANVDSGDYSFKIDGTTNKFSFRQIVGTYAAASTANAAATEFTGAATDPMTTAGTAATQIAKALRADYTSFIDITSGLTKAKFMAATSGTPAAITVNAAAYKDGTDAKVSLKVVVPTTTNDVYLYIGVGGTDALPLVKADIVKLLLSGGVVTIVGEATSADGTKAVGTVATWTSPATKWQFTGAAADATHASWKYTLSSTTYQIDLKRVLAGTASTPGATNTIDTTKDNTFVIWASTTDPSWAAAQDAPAQSATTAYSKTAVTVDATTAKDATNTGGNNNNNNGSTGKHSAIVAFSLMVLATLGLFAF